MAAALEVFAAVVEFDVSGHMGDVVGGGHYRGAEGVANWLQDLYDPWETFEMDADDVIDAGNDQVITVLSARGRGRASGIELEHRPAGIGTLREGKVVRIVSRALSAPSRESRFPDEGSNVARGVRRVGRHPC